jgi:hypothetical protein
MTMWRCPHCATPQPEAARCWVCRRSSTSCGTCRNFRSSVAAQIGYCGLDRRRLPLHGDEIRPCWEAALSAADEPSLAAGEADATRTPVRRLDFVAVGAPVAIAVADAPDRITLWGEPVPRR